MNAPTNRAVRARAILALFGLAIALACGGDVLSISPAITDKEAITMPVLVGTWTRIANDSNPERIQIVRDPDDSSRYRMRTLDPDSSVIDSIARYMRMPRDVAQRIYSSSGWLEARVGRLGNRLVIETTPAPDDTLFEFAEARLSPLILRAFQVRALDVNATELTITGIRADSARAHMRTGRCETPTVRDSTGALLLTGDSPQVRAAYACLLGEARVLETPVRYRRGS